MPLPKNPAKVAGQMDEKPAGRKGYRVQQGDTLWSIAEQRLPNMKTKDAVVELFERNWEPLAQRFWLPTDFELKMPDEFDPSANVVFDPSANTNKSSAKK
jgi:hypothetical protein